MTKNLEQAIEALRNLPAHRQDEIAPFIQMLADQEVTAYDLTDDEKADRDEAIAEIERGEIATDEQVRAIWAKHGLEADLFGSCRSATRRNSRLPR